MKILKKLFIPFVFILIFCVLFSISCNANVISRTLDLETIEQIQQEETNERKEEFNEIINDVNSNEYQRKLEEAKKIRESVRFYYFSRL